MSSRAPAGVIGAGVSATTDKVRWLGRSALEAREVTIDDVREAARAPDEPPERAPDAMERLARLCVAHGVA